MSQYNDTPVENLRSFGLVRRDLRWRLWFLYSFTLGLLCGAWLVLSRVRISNPHPWRGMWRLATWHADILRTGGFLDAEYEQVRR